MINMSRTGSNIDVHQVQWTPNLYEGATLPNQLDYPGTDKLEAVFL